jgi:hypothetical protein
MHLKYITIILFIENGVLFQIYIAEIDNGQNDNNLCALCTLLAVWGRKIYLNEYKLQSHNNCCNNNGLGLDSNREHLVIRSFENNREQTGQDEKEKRLLNGWKICSNRIRFSKYVAQSLHT